VLSQPVEAVLSAARKAGILAGADVSQRIPGGRQLLKLSFSNREQPLDGLLAVFETVFGTPTDEPQVLASPPLSYQRQSAPGLPSYSADEVIAYYKELGHLNVSPDDGCYPLGSCTMKYNPKVNDWAASLPGFTDLHPQAPVEDSQGCLMILHEIQEWFKGITGLPGVTTQPLAGAQGELVGHMIEPTESYTKARARPLRRGRQSHPQAAQRAPASAKLRASLHLHRPSRRGRSQPRRLPLRIIGDLAHTQRSPHPLQRTSQDAS